LRGIDVVPAPLSEVVGKIRTVPQKYYAIAEAFFG
jgi:hypothetical protein